jgi:hypothetical protein
MCESKLERNNRINMYRKKILKYLNHDSRMYIFYKKNTIKFDENNNKTVYFHPDDYCNNFFEYIKPNYFSYHHIY